MTPSRSRPCISVSREEGTLTIIYRRMHLEDVAQVVEIDRLSFPTPWPERSYRFEITSNPASRMFVLAIPSDGDARESGLMDRLLGRNPRCQTIIGFSGCWMVAGEVHISTLAIHPDWRGQKLGELLLWGMVREAIRQSAEMVTLEVRVGNAVAQNLYRKYRFEPVGLRKGYYRDNREDALLMTLKPLDHACREQVAAFGQELIGGIDFVDKISGT
jgi:ribosomal-protein-alanine N-acetyltransferase